MLSMLRADSGNKNQKPVSRSNTSDFYCDMMAAA
jgi:hypothetical protein